MKFKYIVGFKDYNVASINGICTHFINKAIINSNISTPPMIVGACDTAIVETATCLRAKRVAEQFLPVILLIQNPINRFKNICVSLNKTTERQIDDIIFTIQNNIHDDCFNSVVSFIYPNIDTLLFKYPLHVDNAMSLLGLETPVDISEDEKCNNPVLEITEKQLQALNVLYEEDINLYNSIKIPGQLAL